MLPVLLLAGTFVLGTASAATADDPAVPTNYKSSVFDVDPATDGAAFRIVGGDAFVEVVVTPGHTADVRGYFDEPYIRVDADGSVWVNLDSPAYYINQDRYGNVSAPPEADGKGEPRWETVASGGVFAWQDHRVHWMSYDMPPAIAGDEYDVVFPWEFPVFVDGTELSVRGELVWIPTRSSLAPLLAGALGLLPLVFWDRMRMGALSAVVGVGVCLAVVIAVLQFRGTPGVLRGLPYGLILPALATALALLAVLWREKRSTIARLLLVGSGLSLLGWTVVNIGMLHLPVLPTDTLADLQRVGVAVVIWLAISVVVVGGFNLAGKPLR